MRVCLFCPVCVMSKGLAGCKGGTTAMNSTPAPARGERRCVTQRCPGCYGDVLLAVLVAMEMCVAGSPGCYGDVCCWQSWLLWRCCWQSWLLWRCCWQSWLLWRRVVGRDAGGVHGEPGGRGDVRGVVPGRGGRGGAGARLRRRAAAHQGVSTRKYLLAYSLHTQFSRTQISHTHSILWFSCCCLAKERTRLGQNSHCWSFCAFLHILSAPAHLLSSPTLGLGRCRHS